MGANQSQPNRPSRKSDDDCSGSCFFIGRLPGVPRKSDPIGSPVPDTPLHVRRKREQNMASPQQANRNMYGGLEREVSDRTFLQSLIPPKTGKDALIHEGPDAEQLLHQKYQLLESLGVGSTSTVHKCLCKTAGTSDQFYACKVIDCKIIEEKFQGMMDQFQTEIQALKQLQHPGIIQLYDVYITPDKIFIIMELMQGGELFDYVVQKGTLTEDEAAKIVRKVTSALDYLHQKGFVHRDLKPENLLLKRIPKSPQDDIDVKIIDFGLSKEMEEPIARTFLGTRGYLAPEMLQRRDYTRAVDTWALGVIVFVLLCGCLPFDDDSATVPSDELVKAKFVLRFPRWAKNLSASAKNLLSHLLDVNPRTRYTAAQALNHPWVQGTTAVKGNFLASPGRIKASPAVYGSAQRSGAYRKKAVDPNGTPPTPVPGGQKTVRKTSL